MMAKRLEIAVVWLFAWALTMLSFVNAIVSIAKIHHELKKTPVIQRNGFNDSSGFVFIWLVF